MDFVTRLLNHICPQARNGAAGTLGALCAVSGFLAANTEGNTKLISGAAAAGLAALVASATLEATPTMPIGKTPADKSLDEKAEEKSE